MIYGYARVSTATQSKDGNSLEDQTKALQVYGCQEIITEAFTGKSMERPQFTRLFQKLQEGDGISIFVPVFCVGVNPSSSTSIIISLDWY